MIKKTNASRRFRSALILPLFAATVIISIARLNLVTVVLLPPEYAAEQSYHDRLRNGSVAEVEDVRTEGQTAHKVEANVRRRREEVDDDVDPRLTKDYDICIVGAGLSGAVLAERYASVYSKTVLIVEKRDHIGGNCYDYQDVDTGIWVSKYGAHLFHTADGTVWRYLQAFSKWTPYYHTVTGKVRNKTVPIPVNLNTVKTLFPEENVETEDDMKAWLEKERGEGRLGTEAIITNSEQVALQRVGKRLYELIFKPYTIKQWSKAPAELGPGVLQRIPVRTNTDPRYFPSDPFQALPAEGYTAMFERMLASNLITVVTDTDYFDVRHLLNCKEHTYYTGPIDAYYAETGWPALEYRSLQFERRVERDTNFFQESFVVNYPEANTDFTRIVEYKHLPMNRRHQSKDTVYFVERSTDVGEPYYPVPNQRNLELYKRYQGLAAAEQDVTFVGRLANYKYFNMDQAVRNALDLFAADNDLESALDGHNPLPSHLVSYAGQLDDYSNPPVNDPLQSTTEGETALLEALSLPVSTPNGLRHRAYPPGNDAVMGLAAYPSNMGAFRMIAGSLRNNGYDGHIILGVHNEIPSDEEEYLQKMDVTYYITEFVDCDPSIMDAGDGGGTIRGKCLKGLENLKVEWGRFELCRQWLRDCKECTGWTMIMDTRDIFFQAPPFISLPPPDEAQNELLFIEEIAPHTNPKPSEERSFVLGNGRYEGRTEPCYGQGHHTKFADRPVLCCGTVIGTRRGMHRMLSVLVKEFYDNNAKPNARCRSPHTTDQWTMNYLYYTGRFGQINRTATVPWGTGPVNTIGTPCVNPNIKENSQKHSQRDLTVLDKTTNYILNLHEPEDSPARIAPVVHQFDRCHKWILPWLKQHPELNHKDKDGKFIPTEQLNLPWDVKRQS